MAGSVVAQGQRGTSRQCVIKRRVEQQIELRNSVLLSGETTQENDICRAILSCSESLHTIEKPLRDSGTGILPVNRTNTARMAVPQNRLVWSAGNSWNSQVTFPLLPITFPHKTPMLGGGLEPPCLSAYAPQTYVSAISPPEQRGHFCATENAARLNAPQPENSV
jgi:hypothetical protein